MHHLFFNLFELDPEDEEDSILMSVLRKIVSKYGLCAIDLFPHGDIRRKGLKLPLRLAVEVKSLQFYLKHLKEKGSFSIDGSFNYSSIDDQVFRIFFNYLTSIRQISSGTCTRPIPPPSRKCILKDILSDNKLESRVSNYFDLKSDSSSLALTREQSDSFLDSIHRDSSSS